MWYQSLSDVIIIHTEYLQLKTMYSDVIIIHTEYLQLKTMYDSIWNNF